MSKTIGQLIAKLNEGFNEQAKNAYRERDLALYASSLIEAEAEKLIKERDTLIKERDEQIEWVKDLAEKLEKAEARIVELAAANDNMRDQREKWVRAFAAQSAKLQVAIEAGGDPVRQAVMAEAERWAETWGEFAKAADKGVKEARDAAQADPS